MPGKIVHDFASFFTSSERDQLNQTLINYFDTTSTQIAVVTVPSLQGYEPNDYATRLFNKWGIGGAKNNNGVLILIKPKTSDERGQAYIVPGYGMEGVIPDAVCNRIVDIEMVPLLKEGRNYEAVNAAVNIIINLSKGSFTADQYMQKTGGKKKTSNVFFIIIIVVFILISIFGRRGGGKNISSKGELPLMILLGLLNSGGGRGSFGGFSSGGGGFGGFGGGRSGGGGAGGSW